MPDKDQPPKRMTDHEFLTALLRGYFDPADTLAIVALWVDGENDAAIERLYLDPEPKRG